MRFVALLCFLALGLDAQSISYNWSRKIDLAKEMLRKVKLEHSNKAVTYTQKIIIPKPRGKSKALPRRQASKPKSRTIIRKRTDYAWKEAALVVMDTDNGNLEIVKIKKAGKKLQNNNPKFKISLEARPSGLTWNGKNTPFSVANPDSTFAVVANKWLERLANGKTKEHIYSPYSARLHEQELVEIGNKHIDDDIYWAMSQLTRRGIGSPIFPNVNIADVVPRRYLKNIVLTEQTDPQELYAFLAGTLEFDPFDRVKVIIGANGEDAYATTTSDAAALGWAQFTKPTWDLMIREFSDAKLPNFKTGAPDHIYALQATALLYNYNLNKLVDALGRKILDDPNLKLYMAAAHNCGINRVISALQNPGKDWRVALRKLGKTDETILFLEKIDYLRQSETSKQ
mgnify:CR=1 FL=1